MNKRHKHYETIVAWAEGKEIQHFWNGLWLDWNADSGPGFYEDQEYRIKPEPKPDVVEECFASVGSFQWYLYKPNLRLTFDGETGKSYR